MVSKKVVLVVIDIKKMPRQHLIWKKKKILNSKNFNFSIFKIEKNFRNPKFSCIFLNPDNQTQSWTSDMFDLLKSNQANSNFSTSPCYFFQSGSKKVILPLKFFLL